MRQVVDFSGTGTEEWQAASGSLFQVMDAGQSYSSLGEAMFVFITSGSIYQRLLTCPDVKKS